MEAQALVKRRHEQVPRVQLLPSTEATSGRGKDEALLQALVQDQRADERVCDARYQSKIMVRTPPKENCRKTPPRCAMEGVSLGPADSCACWA